MRNRIFSLMLAVILTLPVVSCGPASQPPSGDVTTPESTQPAETSDRSMLDDLGEYDFGEYEFKIFSRDFDWGHSKLLVEESNGDILNDAIFKRQQDVSERFNVTFAEVHAATADVSSKFKSSVLAGDNAYDMVTGRGMDLFSFAQEGLLNTIDMLPEINLEKDYWNSSMTEQVKVSGKSYFAVGDISLSAYDCTHILLFSKKRMEDAKLEDIYTVVRDDKWTYDKFDEYCKNMTYDVDGDNLLGAGDAYGYISMSKQVLPNFWTAADINSIEKDKDGNLYFNFPGNNKFAGIYERIFNITYDNDARMKTEIGTGNLGDAPLFNIFTQDRSLFMDCTFYYVEQLRSSDSDFGIIPYPKYDEKQTGYRSRIEALDLWATPVTAEDLTRTSVIIEALCCESANYVIPAYYEIALKGKITRDEESREMLDIIADSRNIDLGDCIWWELIRDGIFNTMYKANDRNLSSALDSKKDSVNAKLNLINEAFAKLDK